MKLVFLLFFVPLGFFGCTPEFPEMLKNPETALTDEGVQFLKDKVEAAVSLEEKARWLFLLGDTFYKRSQKTPSPSPEMDDNPEVPMDPGKERLLAQGAFLRILELESGLEPEARHNLAILFKEEQQEQDKNQDKKDQEQGENEDQNQDQDQKKSEEQSQENNSTEPKDISSLVKDRPEDEKRMEELMVQENKKQWQRQQQTPGNVGAVQKDW